MVYNFPTVTAGLDLDSDIIAAIGQHPNSVGCKLSCGHVGKISRLINAPALRPPQTNFAPFIGRSDCFLPALFLGAAGGIMALVNLAPKAHFKLLNHFKEGQIEKAMEIHRILSNADGLSGKYGGIGFLKAVIVREFGYGSPDVRGPLASVSLDKLSSEDQAILKELIDLEKSLML
jgi:4-hydroxy-2-oxoglutarate aldolase